jgi:LacI family transcriptional regulator
MPKFPKVALLIETSNAYGRGLLSGVQAYMRENRQWSVSLGESGRGEEAPRWLQRWDGDGVIARIETDSTAKLLSGLKIPIVNVSAGQRLPRAPWVEVAEVEVGRLAAEHFLERGFRYFAWCGVDRFPWSQQRGAAFTAAVVAAGFTVSSYEEDKEPLEHDAKIERMIAWLHSLPRPTAVFCCYDILGRQLLDACRRAGLPVPDDVAVLGVDNDELLCGLSHPPLSSVMPNALRTGYEAARLLDRMMLGEKVVAEGHLIPPTGITTRQSTDVLSVADRNVAKAVRYIREHACEGICVDDVVANSGLSRRLLENRFKKNLARSPHEEITRIQLMRVKDLLAHTDLQLTEIAERTGFRYTEYLSAVFKAKVGLPPGKYRNAHRPKGIKQTE